MAEKERGIPMPEINIGLVGHVDHGKTTLTSALSGKWTDTHSEEIRRGITIRLGYADVTVYKCQKCKGPACWCTTRKCPKCFSDAKPVRTISLVDAPGHETLMTTVLSGAALMDGALLVISAHEPVPQPQTREHLTALNIVGIRNIVVVQNKIDLVTEEEAKKNYQQIKDFLKGTVAENAPIIPVSAQHNINIDALIDAIESNIKTPERDPKAAPKMVVARSFDVNKPGTPLKNLIGGVLGGSLLQGTLKVGDEIEIRPGIKIKGKYSPLKTKITGLQKSMVDIKELTPGGLAGVLTELDPAVVKSDRIAGNVLGYPDRLPPVLEEITIKENLLERVVGAKEELKVEPVRTGDVLMLTIGVIRTVGSVTSVGGGKVTVGLKIPVAAEKGDRVAISRQVAGRWRLIGWGEIL